MQPFAVIIVYYNRNNIKLQTKTYNYEEIIICISYNATAFYGVL